jgi:hypothetical protein
MTKKFSTILIFTLLSLCVYAQVPTCQELKEKRKIIDNNLPNFSIGNLPDARVCESKNLKVLRRMISNRTFEPFNNALNDVLSSIRDNQLLMCNDSLQSLNITEKLWLDNYYKQMANSFEQNKNNSAKGLALIPLGLQILQRAQLLGYGVDDEKSAYSMLSKKINNFFKTLADTRLKDIIEEHKYQYAAVSSLFEDEKLIQLSVGESEGMATYMDKISKAMTFDLSLGITTKHSFIYGDGVTEVSKQYDTEFAKPVKIRLKNMFKKSKKGKEEQEIDYELSQLPSSLQELSVSEEKEKNHDTYNSVGAKFKNIMLSKSCNDDPSNISIAALDKVITDRNNEILRETGDYDVIELSYSAFSTITGEGTARGDKIAPDKMSLKVYTSLSNCGDTLLVGLLAPEVSESGSNDEKFDNQNINCKDDVPVYEGDESKICADCGTYPIEAWKDNIFPYPSVGCYDFTTGFFPMFWDKAVTDMKERIATNYKYDRPYPNYFDKLHRAYNLPWCDEGYFKDRKLDVPVMNMVVLKIPLSDGGDMSDMYTATQMFSLKKMGIVFKHGITINAQVTHKPEN